MEHAAFILVLILPSLLVSVITAANAKQQNAAWRAARAKRATAQDSRTAARP